MAEQREATPAQIQQALQSGDLDMIRWAAKTTAQKNKPAILAAAARVATPEATAFLVEQMGCKVRVASPDTTMGSLCFYSTLTQEQDQVRGVILSPDVFLLPMMKRTDDETFVANLKVLQDHARDIGFDLYEAALWALIAGDDGSRACFCRATAEYFGPYEGGYDIGDTWRRRYKNARRTCCTSDETICTMMEWPLNLYWRAEDMCRHEYAEYAGRYLAAVERLKDAAGGYLHVDMPKARFEKWLYEKKISDELIFSLADRTNVGRNYQKGNLLRSAILYKRPRLLQMALDAGYARTWNDFISLADFAKEQEADAEIVAAIMDAQHASSAKPRSNGLFELNTSSRTAMLRTWSVKEKEDGTLCITSYKGYGDDNPATVCVPAEIGGKIVSDIAWHAFSPHKGRTQAIRNARSAVREIIIPSTVSHHGFYHPGSNTSSR